MTAEVVKRLHATMASHPRTGGMMCMDAYDARALLVYIDDLQAENTRLREALVRLRDCDWVISLPDRMDAVRDIARAALRDAAA
jgi:ribosomal protein L1